MKLILIGKTEEDAKQFCENHKSKPKCTIVPSGCAITMQVRENEIVFYMDKDGLIEDYRWYK